MNMEVLLQKSSIFTKALKDQMDRTRERHAAVTAASTQKRSKRRRSRTNPSGAQVGAYQESACV